MMDRKTFTMATLGSSVGLYDWIATASILSLGFFALSYFVFWMELHDSITAGQREGNK